MSSNIAIIPVKYVSERLPEKNFKIFRGKPMFMHSVHYAQRSNLFKKVFVSTDSQHVVDICNEYGLEVEFLRPKTLATRSSQLVQVCEHVLKMFSCRGQDFDNFCMLWATACMRTHNDIIESYAMLDDTCNAVISVTEYDQHPFGAMKYDETGALEPCFQEFLRLPLHEIPRIVVDNSCLAWVKVSAFKQYGTWLPPKMKGYHMPRVRSVDIDTQEDWDLMEYFYDKYFQDGA